jgi:hypothetical protein
MAKIRNEELDQLAGEVLPERTVLSAVPADPGAGAPFSPFCSPNQPYNSVHSNLIAVAGNNQQCGLSNQGQGNGVGILNIV